MDKSTDSRSLIRFLDTTGSIPASPPFSYIFLGFNNRKIQLTFNRFDICDSRMIRIDNIKLYSLKYNYSGTTSNASTTRSSSD